MMYRQFLVMRKALMWLLIGALVFWGWFAVNNIFLKGSDRFNGTLDFTLVTAVAWPLALFAALYGAAFSSMSREPARYLWTLPKPRWRSALEAIAADVTALAVAYIALAVIIYAPEVPVIGARPVFGMLSHVSLQYALLAFALPLAAYGYGAAVGMLFRRAPFVGVTTVPVFLLWMIFANDPADGFMRTFGVLNPFLVFTQANRLPQLHVSFGSRVDAALHWITPDIGIAILVATTLICCTLTACLWSRAEVTA